MVQHVEGPGSYGDNAADDAAMDAVLLATHAQGPRCSGAAPTNSPGTVRPGDGRRRHRERRRERDDHRLVLRPVDERRHGSAR